MLRNLMEILKIKWTSCQGFLGIVGFGNNSEISPVINDLPMISSKAFKNSH